MSDLKHEALKAAPPIVITTYATFSGFTLNEWVAIATIVYILLQVVVLVRKEFLKRPRARHDPADE